MVSRAKWTESEAYAQRGRAAVPCLSGSPPKGRLRPGEGSRRPPKRSGCPRAAAHPGRAAAPLARGDSPRPGIAAATGRDATETPGGAAPRVDPQGCGRPGRTVRRGLRFGNSSDAFLKPLTWCATRGLPVLKLEQTGIREPIPLPGPDRIGFE